MSAQPRSDASAPGSAPQAPEARLLTEAVTGCAARCAPRSAPT
ncbi:hypothetical protein ACWD4N_18610 [Streptomyces sp. NPDC002586]